MRDELAVWIVASVTAASTIASSVLDVILAAEIRDQQDLAPLRSLLFVAFSLQIIALGCVAYLCLIFSRRRRSFSYQIAWLEPSLGAGFNAVALGVSGAALTWLVIKQDDLPKEQGGLRTAGLVVWAIASALHGTFFMLLAARTRKILDKTAPKVQCTNFGITLPPASDLAHGTRLSFCSRDPTLASRPETPKYSRTYSLQSSTTKVGSSFRSKFTRGSARSSLELPPFPAGEATALGSAFDRYDASHVDSETRNTVILSSSPTLTRSGPGLEPIPGSRPGSPDDELSIPVSPTLRQRALGSPTPAMQNSNPFDSIHSSSSPPSSPPNFSRPTSKSQHRPSISEQVQHQQHRFSVSMTDLIHPLFRPDSPNPPQIMTSGTMVTASPLANQPITPKTLSKLRSASDLRPKDANINVAAGAPSLNPKGQWRVMPSVESLPSTPSRPRSKSHSAVKRPSTAGSDTTDTRLTNVDTMGSPGPSIIEDDELPPILPGFVLAAGSRSSLVGYGKRKSVKRDSQYM